MEILNRLIHALPKQFDFYGVGHVQEQNEVPSVESAIGIAFRIFSTQNQSLAWLILIVDSSLDSSPYEEMGNILASHVVSHTHGEDGNDLMISPPQKLTEERLKKVLSITNPTNKKFYTYFNGNAVIPLETVILSTPVEDIGYA